MTVGILLTSAIAMWFFLGMLVGAYLATSAWPLALGALVITSTCLIWAIRNLD